MPQADLTFVSGVLWELDVDVLRLRLKDLEDDADGITFPRTHNHNTSVLLSGVTYSRSVELINGYKIEFEDGQYTVQCVGANHNLGDVKVPNQVSLIIGNAAGLIQVTSGSGLSIEQAAMLERLAKIHGLVTGVPLVVSATERSAGDVVQSIAENAGVVTVTMQ